MTTPSSPFPGPIPLSDQDRIFGRSRETAELIDRLTSDRYVLLYSPSGAGKSSLLYAGLMPVMRDRGFVARKPIRVGIEPGEGPVPFGLNRYVWSCATSLDVAITEKKTLAEYLASADRKELFVFDQFEEILTANPSDEDNRKEFFDQVGDALRMKGRYAVFALREDYLAPLQQYLERLPAQLCSNMRLNLLAIKEARSAIADSVATTALTIDDAAADALVKDLGTDGWVEPVQLQIVCKRLWDSLPDNTTRITVDLLDTAKSGFSTENALEGYYADSVADVAKVSGTPERRIRDWFGESLISANLTRLQVIRGDQKTGTLSNSVVALLDKAHLIRSDVRRNTAWTELTHDRLIRPVTENNLAWKKTHLSLLQSETESWLKGGSSPDRLMRGQIMVTAKRWAAVHPTELNENEKIYLARSVQASRKRVLKIFAVIVSFVVVLVLASFAAEESMNTRLFAAEQADRETAQLVDDSPPDAANEALSRTGILVKAGIMTRLFGWLPGFRMDERDTQQEIRGALIGAAVQHDPRYVSTVFLQDAVECLWFNPDGTSVSVLAGKSSAAYDLSTGAVIAGSPMKRPPPSRCGPPDRRGGKSYREDLPDGWKVHSQPGSFEIDTPSGQSHRVLCSVGEPSRITVDPTGRRAAWVTGRNNYVYVTNLETNNSVSLPAGDLEVVSLRFSPDGTQLAAGGRDQMVRVWQLGAPGFYGVQDVAVATTPLRAHYDTIMDLAFSPDGQTLVSGSADRLLVQWHLPPELGPFVAHLRSDTLAFMPGISLSAEENLVIVHDDGGKILQQIPVKVPVDTIALRRDGRSAAVIHGNGMWEVLDLTSGKSLGGPPASVSTAQRIALSDDGRFVAVSEGAEITLWPVPKNSPMDRQSLVAATHIFSKAPSAENDPNFKTEALAFQPGSHDLIASANENMIAVIRVSDRKLEQVGAFDSRASVIDIATSEPLSIVATLDEQRIIRFLSTDEVDGEIVLHQLGGTEKSGGLKMPGNPIHIAFSKDGKTFYVLMAGGKIMSWNLDDAALRRETCRLAGNPTDLKVCAK